MPNIRIDHSSEYPPSELIAAAVDDGTYVFVSGTVGFARPDDQARITDPLLPAPLASGIEAQTRAAFAYIQETLESLGLSISDIVKVTGLLANLPRDAAGYNAVFSDVFQGSRPARTTFGATLVGDMLVEVECIARRPRPSGDT